MKFLILFLLGYAGCIPLILPLSEKDSKNLKIEVAYAKMGSTLDNHELIHKIIFYESKIKEPITKIVYHGVTLFKDECKHDKSFRRVVTHSLYSSKLILGVLATDSLPCFEAGYYIFKDTLYEMTRNEECLNNIVEGNDDSMIANMLRNIMFRTESIKNSYDELDSVDEKPHIVEGISNISIEDIEREIEKIMNNNRKMDIDISVPGPSGISSHLRREPNEKIKESHNSDMDSD